MLYKKNGLKKLPDSLFRNPTAEYRGAPFWAWNCKLDKDELLRQVGVLGEMGFGGFHMHVRSGMATEYLGDEFMDLVEACTDEAEKKNMLAWLYDEDRWPSGFAGGLVTKDEKHRIKYLLFTATPYEELGGLVREGSEAQTAKRSGNGKLLARYDVELDADGRLARYRRLGEGEEPHADLWYAYVESPKCAPRYNGYTYANLMDKETIDKFIEVTHERYFERLGDRFDKSIPAIFTDEPQFTHKQTLSSPFSRDDVILPWTDDLPETYKAEYGEDIIDRIPELFFEPADGVSQTRYRYHDHSCERFRRGFAANLGDWCEKHGIALTGHMMREPTLSSQTQAVGEAMRSLAHFQLPGIDMLADRHEYTTAKQAASVARQYGREGVMSELYGVTDWTYDFRGHKLQGDWQAALGVTVRVPHLSWVSMEGEAKRDYPASINYQSSWYKDYPLVENHFARLNTALTRGKPVVKVGVIHPVESLWLHWGPSSQTGADRERLDSIFENVTRWLLFGGIDFDYISEALLPDQCAEGSNPLKVGEMKYDAIVVAGCETLRKTTLERLSAFRRKGGKLIFAGDPPKYLDALPSTLPAELCAESEHTELSRASLLASLESERTIEMRSKSGNLTTNLLYQQRRDGRSEWLFVCRGANPYNPDLSNADKVAIKIKGCWKVTLYDTLTGKIIPVGFSVKDGRTLINTEFMPHDSKLYRLTPAKEGDSFAPGKNKAAETLAHPVQDIRAAEVITDEPNVLLLDMFEYSLDGEPFRGTEEILRIDSECRNRLGWEVWGGGANQPWCIKSEPISHTLALRCSFRSDISVKGALLAIERAADGKIVFDGKEIQSVLVGYYTDKSLNTVALPDFAPGVHTLELTLPFGKRTAAERVYLLGDFGVFIRGGEYVITRPQRRIGFGDSVSQGFPFYGGCMTYRMHFDTKLDSVEIRIPHFRAAVAEISIDGRRPVPVAFAPYKAVFEGLKSGRHRLDVTLKYSRGNGFGRIHCADEKLEYPSPSAWRTKGDAWTYEYRLNRQGLLSAPVITEFTKVNK